MTSIFKGKFCLSIKFFIEQFNDYLVTVDLGGKVFFINMQFITVLEDFNWIQVNSNLNSQDIKIRDVLSLNMLLLLLKQIL